MSKIPKKCVFLPCSEPKNEKKWRISAGLRRKNDWWGGVFLLFLMGWADFCKEINKKPEDIADNGEHQVFSRCNWPVLCKTNSTHWWPVFQSSNNGGLMGKSICVRG